MRLIASLLCFLLAACATSPVERDRSARELAARAGWQAETIVSGRFRLLSLYPAPPAQSIPVLAIFIEGDGMAWIDAYTPSADPTPRTPVGLQLALAEPLRPSAYLGRPCQYDPARTPQRCSSADWTQARFSAEVVAAMNAAVTQLKQRFHAEKVMLVGYSGGATIAALLATRRDDVAQLVTVAGLLDHAAWTRAMRISPLAGSLNPADEWEKLKRVPQIHYIGERDRQTGRAAMGPALDAASSTVRVVEMPGFGHECCWAEAWPRLAREQRLTP